jgi:tRNA 2-thiocytidine biosynthesis protein TtcA
MTVEIFSPESFAQAKPSPVDASLVADPKTRTEFNKLQKRLRRVM